MNTTINKVNSTTVNGVTKISDTIRNMAGVEKTEQETIDTNNYTKAIVVELSDDGKRLYDSVAKEKENFKESGKTSAREMWETDAVSIRNSQRYDISGSGTYSPIYMMQLDEPETYARWAELNCKSNIGNQKYGFTLEEIKEAQKERDQIENDWYRRRFSILSEQNLTSKSASVIEKIENKYSDAHDLSINIYDSEGQDEEVGRLDQFSGISLWRYSTKFNMLLTSDMLKKLLGTSEKEKEDVLNRIDSAVNNMKEAEKNYEGDKVFLRFGVKFHTNGNVSYHANYKDCEDSYGIYADSVDELLEKLMKKD